MKLRFLVALLTLAPLASAQHLAKQEVFDAIAGEYSGEGAQEGTRNIIQYHRIQGSPMMTEVAEKVVLARLKSYGIEARLEQFPSDGRTRYATMTSPMAWDMRGGELWVTGAAKAAFEPYRLCRYSDVPMCVSTYSKGGEWEGELVDVGKGTEARHYGDKDLRGKVALAYGYAADVVRQAVLKHGAVGVVIYPDPLDRPGHPDMVHYNGIWPRAEELEKTSGGFQISINQYNELKKLMAAGPVRVRGKIDATLGAGNLTLVHAWIRGAEEPEREIIITAHLDHPKWSANDNASGSGAILEMARALHALIAAGKTPRPKLTLHFMWIPEHFGTHAYLDNHPEARKCRTWKSVRPADAKVAPEPCILANLNLDMVGEDTVKTDSRLSITRSPDSVPSFLDALLADVLQQTREANLFAPTGTRHRWPASQDPFSVGSDHENFLSLGIPAAMFVHEGDWTHHTSEDTIDKTDASEFRRTGVLAAAAAYWLASATDTDWDRLLLLMKADQLRERVRRIASDMPREDSPAAQRRLRVNQAIASRLTAELGQENRGAPTGDKQAPSTASQAASGPQKRTRLPLAGDVFNDLPDADRAWWDQQKARFVAERANAAGAPDLDMLVWETLNFMDGRRSAAEIADLLSAEFLVDVDQAWAEKLIRILAAKGFAATP
jgi:hypothetical protein